MAASSPEDARNGPLPAENRRNPWCFAPHAADSSPSDFIHGTFKGEPSVTIPKVTVASLAARFEHTLIGKFSQGKPPMELIRKFLSIQNFSGAVFEGLLDKKHIVFRFELSADYVRFFSKPIWNVFGKSMRILKWTPDFQFDKEPSIVPIWLCLPKLPLHLVNENFIFSLVSSFSKPLQIDTATKHLRRPSVARVQVEFDLLEMLPSRVWIQYESGRGFWQPILIEDRLPSYCRYCWHIGHEEHVCTVKYPKILENFTHTHEAHRQREFRPKQNTKRNSEHITQHGSQVSNVAAEGIIHDGVLDLGKNTNANTPAAEVKGKTVMVGSYPPLIDEGPSRGRWTSSPQNGYTPDALALQMDTNKNDQPVADKEGQLQSTSVIAALQQEKVVLQPTKVQGLLNAVTNSAEPPQQVLDPLVGFTLENVDMHSAGQSARNEPNLNAKHEVPISPKKAQDHSDDVELQLTMKTQVQEDVAANQGPVDVPTIMETVKEGVLIADHISSVNQAIEYSEGCQTSNPFEILSMPLTEKALKSSVQASIQEELRFMSLDPKVWRGSISDEVFEEKFTPAKKTTRTRKKKQIFDL